MDKFLWLFCLILCSTVGAFIDLEERIDDFVLETRQIAIPGYPEAWNPSIVRWQERLLMSFRIIPDAKSPFVSRLGLVWLDEAFEPVGDAQLLNTREMGDPVPSRAEDGRLIVLGDDLYIVYSDNVEPQISKGGFRPYIARVQWLNGRFFLDQIQILNQFEGESPFIREKNWTPFVHEGTLLLAYSQAPHKIFCPDFKTGECCTVAITPTPVDWDWGSLRGGTSALLVDGEYLSFFHSCRKMETVHSDGKSMLHYFMGVYTFSPEPPFAITRISPEPIVGKNFYHGPIYKPYWGSVRVVFPCGFVFDENYFWVAYGRQDREVWIAKIDREGLFKSLIPVKKNICEKTDCLIEF